MRDLTEPLTEGLAALGIADQGGLTRHLVEYLALLTRWNNVYNLTAVRDPIEMVTRHVLDSLSILPHVRGTHVLDVGTGAGLPGIPLALARHDLHITLLDSNAKKLRFVQQVVAELSLHNCTVVAERLEVHHPKDRYDTVVARAFSSLTELAAGALPLCKTGGCLLAMKGLFPEEELQKLGDLATRARVIPLAVPGLGAERHLVILEPAPASA